MFLRLLLLFTLIPFLEIYLLIEVGRYLGALNTVALVFITGLLGAYLAKLQGLSTMDRVRRALERGEIPANELLDALLILIAGIVLLTPGLLTDFIGLLLLIPQTRNRFRHWLRRKFADWIERHPIDIDIYRQ
ncbi:MAG: membrane protein FxsA [Deltaproteobacteria bacterium]|nr:membrane protein FxsA [Deltaproteobacteria bacterium]